MTRHRPYYHPHAPHPRPRSWHRARAVVEPANWPDIIRVVALWLVVALGIATLIVVRAWGG